MIPYEKDKKRIIVLDTDLKDIKSEDVKNFMKVVVGRHYGNLKNRGSGWSFPAFQEQVFLDWLQPPQKIEETLLPSKPEEPIKTFEDKSVQTDSQDDLMDHFTYKYDIDSSLYEFGKQWLMG